MELDLGGKIRVNAGCLYALKIVPGGVTTIA